MERSESAVIFSGQGTLQASPFTTGQLGAQFRMVLEDVGPVDTSWRTPDGAALLVFAASVAHYQVLYGRGVRPSVIVGHGFGELVALVCAGAFTVRQGAEIAVQRTSVLDRCQRDGGMLSVATNRASADRLVALAGASRTAVAAENGPAEIVVSGTTAGINSIQSLARRRRIATAALKARWPLHCAPLMLPAAMELAKQLRSITWRGLEVPVFSPILGRYYGPSDNLAECLASHLAMPVRFAAAVRTLSSAGIESFIACGPLHGLARNIEELTANFEQDQADAELPADPSSRTNLFTNEITEDAAQEVALSE